MSISFSRQRTVITYAEFISLHEKQGWLKWGYNIAVKKPLSMGWSTLRSMVMNNTGCDSNRFVNLVVLKVSTFGFSSSQI